MSERKNEKKKITERPVILLLIIVSVVLISAVVPIIYGIRCQNEYEKFLIDLSFSLHVTHKMDAFKVTMDGKDIHVKPENMEKFLEKIVRAEYGRFYKSYESDDPRIDFEFSDRTHMTIYEFDLKGTSNLRESGILVKYTDTEGKTYIFDSDKISFRLIKTDLELSKNEEWK